MALGLAPWTCAGTVCRTDTVEIDFLIQPWTLFKPILQDSADSLQDTPKGDSLVKHNFWKHKLFVHTLFGGPYRNGEKPPQRERMSLISRNGPRRCCWAVAVVALLPRPWSMLRPSYWHNVWDMYDLTGSEPCCIDDN